MNSLVKLLYCLVLSKRDRGAKIISYARYTSLIDQRTLSLGMPKKFYIGENDDAKILLQYILNKEEYTGRSKKRLKKIEERMKINK